MNNTYVTISITIAATVVGQLMTKKGMSVAGQMPADKLGVVMFLFKTMLLNPWVLGGLLMAVLAAMSWMATLSKTELGYAYPFMSIAFPLVLLLSGLVFNEHVPMLRWIGMAIIIFGIWVVAKS